MAPWRIELPLDKPRLHPCRLANAERPVLSSKGAYTVMFLIQVYTDAQYRAPPLYTQNLSKAWYGPSPLASMEVGTKGQAGLIVHLGTHF